MTQIFKREFTRIKKKRRFSGNTYIGFRRQL